MRHFRNILYVIHGTRHEKSGLEQALGIAHTNQAPLTLLVICPEFPGNMPEYREKFEQALQEQARQSVEEVSREAGINPGDVDIHYKLESGSAPAIRIIQQVLKDGYDLVIKEAEPAKGKNGFRAVDIDLLSKCPCPVWLCRPTDKPSEALRIAAAVDPQSEKQSARDMSLRILQLGSGLAKLCSGELHIVSCWDYRLEHELKNNIFLQISDQEIEAELKKVQEAHQKDLQALIAEADMSSPHQLHHMRGEPSETITRFVEEQDIDILVMGTVARTGIPGFLLGNTAEDILHQLSSSLIALKPADFESPVKAR